MFTSKINGYVKSMIKRHGASSGDVFSIATVKDDNGYEYVYFLNGYMGGKITKALYPFELQPATLAEAPENGTAKQIAGTRFCAADEIKKIIEQNIATATEEAKVSSFEKVTASYNGRKSSDRVLKLIHTKENTICVADEYLNMYEWKQAKVYASRPTAPIMLDFGVQGQAIILPVRSSEQDAKVFQAMREAEMED